MLRITWRLGETSGVELCKTDNEATKFSKELMDKKMQLIGEKLTTMSRFENKVYRVGARSNRPKYARSYAKRVELQTEYDRVKEQIGILQTNILSVSIEHLKQAA